MRERLFPTLILDADKVCAMSRTDQPNAVTPFFTSQGRIEARRVLRPSSTGPRMEISFGSTLRSPHLGNGNLACTFMAQPQPDGSYRWTGRGLLLLPQGNVSLRSEATGCKAAPGLRYTGWMLLRPHAPALAWLSECELRFDYWQDMQTLEVGTCAYSPDAAVVPPRLP